MTAAPETPDPGPSGQIQVGLFLTNQHPPEADLVRSLRDQLDLMRVARDLGWDSVWAGHHYLPETMAMPQPLPFLSRITAESEHMSVGMGILLLALHNPLDVAETFATLDVLSEGRLIFGVGLGYREIEYEAFGIRADQRVHRFTENLRLVKALWTGDGVDAELPWCRLENASLTIRPIQEPRPPIWMAANAHPAVRRAATMADAWFINPHASFTTIKEQMAIYQEARTEAELPRATTTPLIREIHCAPTRRTALERVRPYLERKYEAYADWGQDRALPGDESFRVPFETLTKGRFVIGSPDDCVEHLLRWRDDIGVNQFVLRTDWIGMPHELARESIELISAEVLPALREP